MTTEVMYEQSQALKKSLNYKACSRKTSANNKVRVGELADNKQASTYV